jgi:hypothetical protein
LFEITDIQFDRVAMTILAGATEYIHFESAMEYILAGATVCVKPLAQILKKQGSTGSRSLSHFF